jgi:hypothetical protein
MEALVVVDPQPGIRLHFWQRCLLWLLTRAPNVQGVVVEHRNRQTRWIWCRIDLLNAPLHHLERCYSQSTDKP